MPDADAPDADVPDTGRQPPPRWRPRHGHAGALLRYALIGAVATAGHYLLLGACVEWWRWPAWLGSGAGAVLGAQLAFLGNRHFTFAHHGPAAPAWWRFQATAAAGALLGMACVAIGVAAGLHYLLAQAIATLGVWALTYVINQRWSFASPA